MRTEQPRLAEPERRPALELVAEVPEDEQRLGSRTRSTGASVPTSRGEANGPASKGSVGEGGRRGRRGVVGTSKKPSGPGARGPVRAGLPRMRRTGRWTQLRPPARRSPHPRRGAMVRIVSSGRGRTWPSRRPRGSPDRGWPPLEKRPRVARDRARRRPGSDRRPGRARGLRTRRARAAQRIASGRHPGRPDCAGLSGAGVCGRGGSRGEVGRASFRGPPVRGALWRTAGVPGTTVDSLVRVAASRAVRDRGRAGRDVPGEPPARVSGVASGRGESAAVSLRDSPVRPASSRGAGARGEAAGASAGVLVGRTPPLRPGGKSTTRTFFRDWGTTRLGGVEQTRQRLPERFLQRGEQLGPGAESAVTLAEVLPCKLPEPLHAQLHEVVHHSSEVRVAEGGQRHAFTPPAPPLTRRRRPRSTAPGRCVILGLLPVMTEPSAVLLSPGSTCGPGPRSGRGA
jgi:hypothetical protein